MIFVLDHYDSFVETLARYVREAGHATCVHRPHDGIVEEVVALRPSAIILSPGPGRPTDFPQTLKLIERFSTTPILGVCLGHQALIEFYGGRTIHAATPMHGRSSVVYHDNDALFSSVPNPFQAGRYHSLLGSIDNLSSDGPLTPIAWLKDGTVMGVRHAAHPHVGVQFHPESLLTEGGRRMLQNFLATVRAASRPAPEQESACAN